MNQPNPCPLLVCFEQHYDELCRFLAQRTGSREQAREVAQEAWLKLANGCPTKPAVANPRAYLYRLVSNLATDWERSEARRSDRRVPESAAGAVVDALACPQRRTEARDQLAALDAVLVSLPYNVRQAVLLSRVEGWTFARIAEELGVSESMVAKYIARGLRVCRDHLADA